jgi:lysozyme
MKASQACLDLIKHFEGFKAAPYLCPAHKPTIGYGSCFYGDGRPVTLKDSPISEPEAVALLAVTLGQYEQVVTKAVKVTMTQGQFDALVSFAYNAGPENMKTSTLVRKLNDGDVKGAAGEFDRWVYGGGVRLKGLTIRREAERRLFVS